MPGSAGSDGFENFLENPLTASGQGSLGKEGSGSHEFREAFDIFCQLRQGEFEGILKSRHAELLLGHRHGHDPIVTGARVDAKTFEEKVLGNIAELLRTTPEGISASRDALCVCLIGYASLLAFLQSNVTGPPLSFDPGSLMFGFDDAPKSSVIEETRKDMIRSLSVDGVATYPLIPNIELFFFAKVICKSPNVKVMFAQRLRLQVTFLHQRLLSEASPTLELQIDASMRALDPVMLSSSPTMEIRERVEYLLERAAIHTFYDHDIQARADLERAANENKFQFALTGMLGKRTKFQEKDLSQLIVLALSSPNEDTTRDGTESSPAVGSGNSSELSLEQPAVQPSNLELNDDTLLESISFAKTPRKMDVQEGSVLPPALASLDPSNQPPLGPLDAITLLSIASSITNTSPAHGLTREETLPYATRVLDSGSTNWQIYTQALLVRSRIEGYRSRTQERGVLQLQALVDQVVAETTKTESADVSDQARIQSTTFLPMPKPSEIASAAERLRYIHQLNSPTRWELESELAARWISLGGLKTALEIYERLRMWAEVALCWAGLEREDRAKVVLRKQLYESRETGGRHMVDDDLTWDGPERDPLPADGPRLFCILGDVNRDPKLYERAWEVSDRRYARAQRSLGKYYFTAKDFRKSAEAYATALKINRLNHGSWYALGCARLQLDQWDEAVDAFSNAVRIDNQDAESWSNLGAALVEKDAVRSMKPGSVSAAQEWEEILPTSEGVNPNIDYRRDALNAFKHAANLKHDSWRIWDNVLTIAASTSPPAYTDCVVAMSRIIELRGAGIGEKCVDEQVLELLVHHILTRETTPEAPSIYDKTKPGLHRMVVDLIDKQIIPLITSSSRLWHLVAKVALWRQRPGSALEAHEKAWRAVMSQPGWEVGTETQWNGVVGETVDLADAYESLGPMPRTEGLGAVEGQIVAKDWKFKARSAIRGILAKGKESWEGTDGWERLMERSVGLRSGM
ncbi:MAG: hypothetical protein M1833_000172 [Piccolia ochrophora]|nr:MAG: hypothetical protein M1833_000172 [Piccolia ochrophora]